MTWIQTYTGRQFWPLDPQPEHVCLEDIAHALGMICRFNGHCRRFYSVAEHSIYVAQYVLRLGVAQDRDTTRLIRLALLHDAAEAYLGDVCRPIKSSDFVSSEKKVHRCICEALEVDIDASDQKAIKFADNVLLATEARDLMKKPPVAWDALPSPREERISDWVLQYSFGHFWLLAFNDPLGIVAKQENSCAV